MTAHLVSVIIPTHHRRELVLRLLDALAKQTLSSDAFEVIVVHNYTDDGTEEAIASWAAVSPMTLRYYRKNYNGPAASRQFAAEVSDGAILAFIDDDCLPQPNWLQAGLEHLVAADSQGVKSGLVQGRTLPNPDQARRFLEKTVNIPEPSIYFETCNIFYRREVFFEVGGFSREFLSRFYGEDTDLGWKTIQAGYQPLFAPEALVYHEVFHVSAWRWLREPLFFKNLPYLVHKFPEMRKHMWLNYFLTRETGLFDLALVGTLSAFWTGPGCLLLSLPYLLQRYHSGSHIPNPLFRLARVVAGIPRSACMFWALAKGTVQYRSWLL